MSQNGNLPQIGVNIKNMWNHHLDFCWCLKCLHKVLLSHFFETNCQVETPVCPSQHLLGAGKVIETHLVVWNAKPKKVTTKKTSLELPTPKKTQSPSTFKALHIITQLFLTNKHPLWRNHHVKHRQGNRFYGTIPKRKKLLPSDQGRIPCCWRSFDTWIVHSITDPQRKNHLGRSNLLELWEWKNHLSQPFFSWGE